MSKLMDLADLKLIVTPPEEKLRLFIRLSTSYWHDKNGLHIKRDIKTLKRKTTFDFLWEECGNIGAEDTLTRINNLDTCPDGIYEVIFTHIVRDWESGYIDDYDFELRPVKE